MAAKKKSTALSWIVKEAKDLKKKYPKRFFTWKEYVAQASAIYASKHKGKSPVGKKKKVGVAKKTTVKKVTTKKAPVKKMPLRSTHKDTKSHNVNIRVMSGFNDEHLKDLNKWVGILRDKENRLKIHQDLLSRYIKQKDKESIADQKKIINFLKLQIKYAKKHITIIKRQIR